MLRTLAVTRYVTPLREGGSLPAIVEAEDDGLYVLKFRGAGQGTKALIAELVVGELGCALGQMSQSERFHWLVSPRSTIIQTSQVHSGLSADPRAALEHPLKTMVYR